MKKEGKDKISADILSILVGILVGLLMFAGIVGLVVFDVNLCTSPVVILRSIGIVLSALSVPLSLVSGVIASELISSAICDYGSSLFVDVQQHNSNKKEEEITKQPELTESVRNQIEQKKQELITLRNQCQLLDDDYDLPLEKENLQRVRKNNNIK